MLQLVTLCCFIVFPLMVLSLYSKQKSNQSDDNRGNKHGTRKDPFFNEVADISPVIGWNGVVYLAFVLMYMLAMCFSSRGLVTYLEGNLLMQRLLNMCKNNLGEVCAASSVIDIYRALIEGVWSIMKTRATWVFNIFDLCIVKTLILSIPATFKLFFVLVSTIFITSFSYNIMYNAFFPEGRLNTVRDILVKHCAVGLITPILCILTACALYYVYYIIASFVSLSSKEDPLSMATVFKLCFGILPQTYPLSTYLSGYTVGLLVILIAFYIACIAITLYGDKDDTNKKLKSKQTAHVSKFAKHLYISFGVITLTVVFFTSRMSCS